MSRRHPPSGLRLARNATRTAIANRTKSSDDNFQPDLHQPVGALPDPDEKNAVAVCYVELRHEGRPVDPQPRLAKREDR